MINSDGNTHTFAHGNSTDIPIPGDYDGDGKADYAIFRPSADAWYIYYSFDLNNYQTIDFGQSGDIPIPFYL